VTSYEQLTPENLPQSRQEAKKSNKALGRVIKAKVWEEEEARTKKKRDCSSQQS